MKPEILIHGFDYMLPAAFRRLCVETCLMPRPFRTYLPAAFRRLCVETPAVIGLPSIDVPSRLQAAVC